MSSGDNGCRCAQSNCLECLMRATEQVENFDETRDCPTFGGEHRCGQYKTIERTCGVDFATLADTIGTPPEHRIVVMVSAATEPNSAVRWFGREHNTPACHQLFFFDARRSVRTLKRLVGDCVVINHCTKTPRTMRFRQTVGQEHWRLCQCDRFGCPGTGHRFRQLQARLGKKFEPSADAVAHTECAAASMHYDRIGLQMAEHEVDATAAGTLDQWRVFDSKTRMPLLPEPYDVEELRRSAFADDDAHLSAMLTRYAASSEHGAKRCAQTIDPLRFDTTVAGQLPNAPLRVEPIDREQVKKFRRNARAHCAPLCAAHLAKALDRILIDHQVLDTLSESYAKLKEARTAADDSEASDSESDSESDGSSMCLSRTCAHLDIEQSLRPLVNKTLAAAGARRTHPIDCSCLAEHFIDQCDKQLSLDLVPLPTNPLFPNNGDTVLDIESPLMRELGAKQAVALLMSRGVLDTNPIVADAARGTQFHFETAIVRLPALRKMLATQFGQYAFSFDRDRACFAFERRYSERVEELFTRYAAAPSSRISRPQQRRVLGRKYDAVADTYEAMLRDAQSLVAAELRALGKEDDAARAANARTLTEVALHRGMLGSADSVRRRKAWLPPAALYCLESTLAASQCVEKHARHTLAHSGSTQIILGPVCERSIVDELHATDNRRMLMARVTTCLMGQTQSTREFAETVLFLTAALVVVDLCECLPNLRATERQRVAEEARRALEARRLEERRIKQAERAEARKLRDKQRQLRAIEEQRAQEAERVLAALEAERQRAQKAEEARAAEQRELQRVRLEKKQERRRQKQKKRRQTRERAEEVAQQLRAAQQALVAAEHEKKLQSQRQPSLEDFLRLEAQIDFFNGGAFSMLSVQ